LLNDNVLLDSYIGNKTTVKFKNDKMIECNSEATITACADPGDYQMNEKKKHRR